MSNSGHLFISYSRKQFYFTESLVLHLQERQVDAWLDVQRLVPGSNWDQSLREGYDSCAGLILVASRASLTSEFVRKEWEAVLKAGKPIYIVLFELVQLPPELDEFAAIIDFRGSFNKVLKRLLQAIQQKIHYRAPLPLTNRWRLPTRLPVGLWGIMSVFWLQITMGIVFFLSTVLLFPQVSHQKENLFFFISATVLMTIIYVLYYALAFLYRWNSASYKMIRLMLWVLPGGLLGTIATFDPTLSKSGRNIFSPINIPPWFHLFSITAFLLLVIGGGMSLVLPRLEDALRWFPTGTVPEEVRRRVNNRIGSGNPKRGLRRTSEQSQPNLEADGGKRPTARQFIQPGFIDARYNMPTYWLHYNALDEDIAHRINYVLCGTYNLSKSSEVHDSTNIVLLTNRTPRAWVSTLKDPSQAIYIVASSIRIPEEIKNFHRLQWVDYRLRQVDQLEQVRELLNEPPRPRTKYQYPAVPESLERFVVPPKIFWLSLGIGSLSIYPLAEGISSLLLPPLPGQMPPSASIVLISLLSGSLSIWMSYQIREFKLSYGSVLMLLGLVSLGSILSGVFSFVSILNILSLLGSVSTRSVFSRVVPQGASGCSSMILPVLVLSRFIRAHRILKEHSPRHVKLFSQQPTFSIPIWHKEFHIYIFLLLAIAEVVFLNIFPLFP
jgi:hypothetical protein